ncbi:CatB-related O-acetyltransferase [Nocardioides jensenii]|uniref:CatB-related O-acetyltransferase n=1 Tax=Nocardioides jensenii TaxID=1843 RepID=UPI00082DCAA2|nr:CatB-related O-acetyltransferase [Nocardioides jensenii]
MLNFLRFVKYALLRGRDAVIGKNIANLNRLVKAGRVTVGEHTYGGPPMIKTFTHDNTRLTIGKYSSISGDALILLGGKHATDALTTYPHRILWKMDGAGEDGFPMKSKDSFIGSDVWLCDNAIVLTGIRIGHGAIIGAGAVVTKDVPDYAIVGGNPAKVISYRFPEEQRKALLDIAWWDWPDEDVRDAVPLIAGKDVDALIAYAAERDKRLGRG